MKGIKAVPIWSVLFVLHGINGELLLHSKPYSKNSEESVSGLPQEPIAASQAHEPSHLNSANACFTLDQRFSGGEPAEATTAEECQTKCLNAAGCLHFNFLTESASCEHVFSVPGGPSVSSPPLEPRKGALAADAQCYLPKEFLSTQRPTAGKNGAYLEEPLFRANSAPLPADKVGTREARNGASTEVPASSRSGQTCSDKYVLADSFKGNDFWEPAKFYFFEWGDPTGGTVKYVSKSEAQKYKLIKTTSDGRAQIFADATEKLRPDEGRKAVRLTSQKAWSDVGNTKGNLLHTIKRNKRMTWKCSNSYQTIIASWSQRCRTLVPILK